METLVANDSAGFGQESVFFSPPSVQSSTLPPSSTKIHKKQSIQTEPVALAEGLVFAESAAPDSILDALEEEFFSPSSVENLECPVVSVEESVPVATNPTEPVQETPGLYNSQFNLDGMPTAHPFPLGCLPNREPLKSMVSEFAYPSSVSADAFERHIIATPLGQLPTSYQDMAAPDVPRPLVQQGMAFIVYAGTSTKTATKDATTSTASQSAVSFYRRFGVHVTNDAEDGGRLINWRTLFYVVDYMRRYPTASCYTIEDQPFVEFAGVDREYDFDNWHVREEHAVRLFAIALCTQDSESSVCQLDRLLRFKRSQGRDSHCITIEGKALIFADYTIDDEGRRVHTAWIDVALNNDVVQDLLRTRHSNEEYYDGPYCETCRVHHCKLSYCNQCHVVQYCSLKCKKQDSRKHKKLCIHNRK